MFDNLHLFKIKLVDVNNKESIFEFGILFDYHYNHIPFSIYNPNNGKQFLLTMEKIKIQKTISNDEDILDKCIIFHNVCLKDLSRKEFQKDIRTEQKLLKLSLEEKLKSTKFCYIVPIKEEKIVIIIILIFSYFRMKRF